MNTEKTNPLITALLLSILLIPNIATLFFSEDVVGFPAKMTGYSVVVLICIFLPTIFLKKKQYFLLEGLLSIFIAPIEISSLYLSHTTTNFMMMDTILNTNIEEAIELLTSLYSFVISVVGIWILYFFLVFKYVRKDTFLPQKVQKVLLISLPIVFLIGCVYFFTLTRITYTSEKTTLKDNLIDTKDMMVSKFNKIFPFDVYLATIDVLQKREEVKASHEKLKDFSFGLQPKENNDEETYVLVIGETARWKNFGINGYHRNTTTNLSKVQNLVSYSHFVTQANLTSNSIPLILTRADASNKEIANNEKSISEAFSEAGFYTSWISDQIITPFQERIIETCNHSAILSKDITLSNILDEDLLVSLDTLLDQKSPKKFIIIHTLGSHFRYFLRYPMTFQIYQPEFDNSMDFLSITAENKNLLVNSYDNSIAYTDYFLSSVIKTLDKKCNVWSMIYLSDHGENIFDDERNIVLHGSLVVTDYEVHIPFFVSYSDAYQEKYPNKVQNILNNKDKNTSSDVVFHSLLDMADIPSNNVFADSLSICSGQLRNIKNTYILNGNKEPVFYDFDRLDSEKYRQYLQTKE